MPRPLAHFGLLRCLGVLFVLGLGLNHAVAHHLMAVPHVRSDPNYAEPVMSLLAEAGDWEVSLIQHPAHPAPAQPVDVELSIAHRLHSEKSPSPVVVAAQRVGGFTAPDRIRSRELPSQGDNAFRSVLSYPSEGLYLVQVEFSDGDTTSSVAYQVVVGSPGSPCTIALAFGAGLALLLVVVRAVHLKRDRNTRTGTC